MSEPMLTKRELLDRLGDGERLGEVLPLTKTRNFIYYKADEFTIDNNILYIADSQRSIELFMDAIWDFPLDLLDISYTGKDFVSVCRGDKARAKQLFDYADGRTLKEILLPDSRRDLNSLVLKEMVTMDKKCPNIDEQGESFLDFYNPWMGLESGNLLNLCKERKWFGLNADSGFPTDNKALIKFLALGGNDNTKVTFKTIYEMGKLVQEFTDEKAWELIGLEGIICRIFKVANLRISIPPEEDLNLLRDYQESSWQKIRDKCIQEDKIAFSNKENATDE